MKRIVSIILCLSLLLSLLALTSCHGAPVTHAFEVPDGLDESKTYEITFWAKNDSNQTQIDIYEGAIRDFEALYPNIKVNLKRYTNYGTIYQDVLTNIPTGTTPNVCITYPDHIATYMTGENVVVPLDALITDPKYGLGGSELRFDGVDNGEIVEKFLTEGVLGGTQYAIPFMRSTEAVYVNKTMVEALTGEPIPEMMTWDYIFGVAEKAIEKNPDGTYKGNGQDTLIPFIYKSTDNMMIQMLKQKGAGYSREDGSILLFNDDTKEILYTVHEAIENKSFSTFAVSSYPGNWFVRGQCLFAIDSTAGATWMGPDAPLLEVPEEEIVDFEVGVYPVPQFDVENPKMISQGPSLCIFNKEDPEEVLASWLFAQFLLTDDIQIGFSMTEGYIPVTTTAHESPEYLDYLSRAGEDNTTYYDVKIKAARVMLDNIDSTFVTPVFNGSTSLRNAAGQLIEEVVKGTNRKQTIDDEFIEKLYDKMNSLYKLNETKSMSGKPALGEMPTESIILLSSIGAVWLGIGGYLAYAFIKKRENK
ncbi:MAG: extracellular solute-binding protein [Clostridia bacterium]|nr:extracellular solute-binding protein [Clostridia bacterium]